MSNLGYLIAKKEELEAKALKLSKEIDTLEEDVNEKIIELSKDGGSFGGVTVSGGGGKPLADKNGIIDYSVTMDDLDVYKTVTTKSGETYQIYKSDKTDALYIITEQKQSKKNTLKKKELYVALKDKLDDNQMLIVTFDGKPYQGDVYNANKSTKDFALVAKNQDGKMFTFYNERKEKARIPKKEPLVLYNGLALPSHGHTFVETGTEYNFDIIYQSDDCPGTISKQSGLRRCAILVQKKDKNAHHGIGQDDGSVFIINDPVLEKYCYRRGKENCYLDPINANDYPNDNSYHTIFNESIDEYQKKLSEKGKRYDQEKGFLGTHDTTFSVTLKTMENNIGYWNSYNMTLEGVSMTGSMGQKEEWSTMYSYCVDDWKDVLETK